MEGKCGVAFFLYVCSLVLFVHGIVDFFCVPIHIQAQILNAEAKVKDFASSVESYKADNLKLQVTFLPPPLFFLKYYHIYMNIHWLSSFKFLIHQQNKEDCSLSNLHPFILCLSLTQFRNFQQYLNFPIVSDINGDRRALVT